MRKQMSAESMESPSSRRGSQGLGMTKDSQRGELPRFVSAVSAKLHRRCKCRLPNRRLRYRIVNGGLRYMSMLAIRLRSSLHASKPCFPRYGPMQRRGARVVDSRFLVTNQLAERITEKYRHKLQRKAQQYSF